MYASCKSRTERPHNRSALDLPKSYVCHQIIKALVCQNAIGMLSHVSTKIHCDYKLFVDAGPVVFAHCMKSDLAQSLLRSPGGGG